MRILFYCCMCSIFLALPCSNEFEVTAPWRSVPVMYGILSPIDTAHYIRVEKAFLDPETSALTIAQIPDSLYYGENEISVFLVRKSTGQQYQMRRVDGNLEGYVREDGIFATQPNWLYKIKPNEIGGGLVLGEKYLTMIQYNDNRAPVSAEISIPRDFIISAPSPVNVIRKITFKPGNPAEVIWRADSSAVYFNVTFVIRYIEKAPDNTQIGEEHELIWKPLLNKKRDDKIVNTVDGKFFQTTALLPAEQLFDFLAEKIPDGGLNFRFFEIGEIIIEGGGAEIEKFLETAAANLGLTGSEIINQYTNLTEGFGIVTSKNQVILDNVRLSTQTVDEMNKYTQTIPLKFRY